MSGRDGSVCSLQGPALEDPSDELVTGDACRAELSRVECLTHSFYLLTSEVRHVSESFGLFPCSMTGFPMGNPETKV